MPLFEDPPLHDFPDRAIRRLLEDPGNLRDLLAAVIPDLVDRFDFEHLELLPRTFLLDDWRRRESDLLFRLPFSQDRDLPPALVCVLIEHQSEADPWMPLRILVYAELYWNEEWKAWEACHTLGERPRLSPVVPIIFHTGGHPWRTNRELADLIDGPEAFRAYAPRWQPLFWDLAEHDAKALLEGVDDWLAALAVVRAEQEAAAEFQEVFAAVLRRLESLSDRERVRWHDLLWFLLSWGLRRRPSEEQEPLFAAAQASQMNVQRQEEMRRLSEMVKQTWEQELITRGEAQGQLSAYRKALRVMLEERFGPLPQGMVQRIDATNDLGRLEGAMRQVFHVTAPDDLDL